MSHRNVDFLDKGYKAKKEEPKLDLNSDIRDANIYCNGKLVHIAPDFSGGMRDQGWQKSRG